MNNQLPVIDPLELRQVLSSFFTGVTVITALDPQGQAVGLTVNSFASVSLQPPLVLWSQSLTAPSHPVFLEAERFAVSILAADQSHISDRFARAGAEKFKGVATEKGLGGVPLIAGAVAHLECLRHASYPGGDHTIYLGRVVRLRQASGAPLVFGGGRYIKTGNVSTTYLKS